MKKIIALLLALVMVIGLVACGTPDSADNGAANNNAENNNAADNTPADDASDDAADDEVEISGKLVLYSTLSETAAYTFTDAFVERYPDVEIEIVSGGIGELMARVTAEAGDPQADVVVGGLADTDGDMYEEYFEKYVSVHDDKMMPGFESNGYYNYDGMSATALCVNDELEAELGFEITSYADLLRPELKGKVIMADPNSSSSAWNQVCNIMSCFGVNSDEAWAFIEGLLGNAVIASSSSATFNSVADGEYVVGLTYESGANIAIAEGADNIHLVYPTEGTSASASGVAIIKGAQNLDAAKAFVDFIVSAEAREIHNEQVSVLRGCNTEINYPADSNLVPSEDIYWVERPVMELVEQKEAILEKWNEIYARVVG